MDDQKLLLTVIITVFNVEIYIRRCLDSIIGQTYKNLEIIVIDDGSVDASGKICDDYSKKDVRIKVYHKENAGLVSARRQGVEQAKGDLITFVDADDWIENNMYECMLDDYNDEDMITSGLITEWKGSKGLLLDSFSEGTFEKSAIENIILQQMMYYEITGQQGITASVCNKLFRTKLLNKIIKLVDRNLTFGEDGATVYCFLAYSNKIKIIKRAWYHYMQHDDSMIRTNSLASFEKLYRLEKNLIANLERCIPLSQLKRQIKHYIEPTLKYAIIDVYGFDIDTLIYMFPYDNVPLNSKIILYGAGNVGYSFWKNIRCEDYIRLVAWTDKDYVSLRKRGLPVESLESALSKEYDYVVIAIENEKIVQEIQNILLGYGLKREKIIWKKAKILH